MKKIIVRAVAILCLLGLAGMFLLGSYYAANSDPWFDNGAERIKYTYFTELVFYVIIGASVISFIHNGDKLGEKKRAFRWLYLLPAVITVCYMAFYYSSHEFFPASEEEWTIFKECMFKLCVFVGFCFLATFTIRRIIKDRSLKWKTIMLGALAVFLLPISIDYHTIYAYYWSHLNELYAFFMPLVFYITAKTVKRKCAGNEKLKRAEPLIYYGVVLVLLSVYVIWYVQSNYLPYDILLIVLLAVTSLVALWYAQEGRTNIFKWVFSKNSGLYSVAPVIPATLIGLASVFMNKRFLQIFGAFNSEGFSYWLDYRITVLKENADQVLDSIEYIRAYQVPVNNSIAWLHYLFGGGVVAAALVLIFLAFFFLGKCVKNSTLGRYLYTVLLCRTVIGLLANLFLVHSTQITPLMMGIRQYDIIFIIIILFIEVKRVKKE